MKKIYSLLIATILGIIIIPPVFAEEEFDPLADLFTDDTLLGLDLPEDFDKEPNPTELIETSLVTDTEISPEETSLTILPSTTDSTNTGGSLADESENITELITSQPTPSTLPTIKNQYITPTQSYTNFISTPTEIPSFSYATYLSPHQKSNHILTATGPATVVAVATLLSTLSVTCFLRRKNK